VEAAREGIGALEELENVCSEVLEGALAELEAVVWAFLSPKYDAERALRKALEQARELWPAGTPLILAAL
jgi:hypothetical protein